MAATRGRALSELGRSVIALLLREPFYGHVLSGVVRVANEETPTAGVALGSTGVRLLVNPTFFCTTLRRKDERVAVVKHEVLHLVLRHLFRGLHGHYRDARLFNIAADLVVNQLIRPWPLPEGAVTLATFPDLNLKPDETVGWYYARLDTLAQSLASGSDDSEDGASGDPSDATDAPQSARALRELLQDGLSTCDHDGWSESSPRSDTRAQAVAAELDRLLVDAWERTDSVTHGRLPGIIKQAVSEALERRKPQVDWRRVMRIFTASSRRTRIVGTRRRESRRYADDSGWLGRGDPQLRHGRPIVPGIQVKRFQRLVVVVDTSGSVSTEELGLFFSEIHGMWRGGAEVTVVECDAAVQHSWTYQGLLPETISGRGGTRFDPAFAWIRDSPTRWDAVIYLTDGEASPPTLRPGCPLLWVVTADGSPTGLPWGRVVQLPAG